MSDDYLERLRREDPEAWAHAACRAEGHEWGDPTLWGPPHGGLVASWRTAFDVPLQRGRLRERVCRRCGEGDYRHGPWAYPWERDAFARGRQLGLGAITIRRVGDEPLSGRGLLPGEEAMVEAMGHAVEDHSGVWRVVCGADPGGLREGDTCVLPPVHGGPHQCADGWLWSLEPGEALMDRGWAST